MKKISLSLCFLTTALSSGCIGVGLVDCTYVEDPNTGTSKQVCIPSKSTLTRMNPESQENLEKLKQAHKQGKATFNNGRPLNFLDTPLPTTTAMYTPPSLLNSRENIYSFSIAVGGAMNESVANQRAKVEINKFMAKKGFARYKILARKSGILISRFVYTVQFYN